MNLSPLGRLSWTTAPVEEFVGPCTAGARSAAVVEFVGSLRVFGLGRPALQARCVVYDGPGLCMSVYFMSTV